MKLSQAVFSGRVRLVVMAWAVTSLFFTAVLMVSDLGGRKALSFALYANAVQFALWAMLLPVLSWCAAAFPITGKKKTWNIALLLLIVAMLGAVVAVVDWAIIYWTYFPYKLAYPTFRSFLQAELIRFMPMDVLIGIVIVVALAGWRAWLAFQEERTRANDLERELAVARLQALRMQLHPHFLFNTLHTIAGLTLEDPPLARRMVIALGDLLRSTLKDRGEQMRTLAEELEYSDLYLGIEKLRFGDRLVLNYDIEPSATRAFVPQFLLQPLFENAIRHGASRMTGPCEIHFCAFRTSSTLDIVIRNDGPRHDPSTAPPLFGVGLTNTTDRLRVYYADRHRFRYFDRPEGGAQVEISIPWRDTGDGLRTSSSPARKMIAQDRADETAPEATPMNRDT